MSDQTIKCPQCGAQIPLTEALTGQIEQSIKLRYEAEASAKEKDYQAKLKEIQQQTKELEAKGEAIEQQVAEQLKTKSKEIAETERKKILAEQSQQTKALEEELGEKNQKLKEFQQQEIELRTQQRKLQEEKEAFELEAIRKLDQERNKIIEEASKKAVEENMLKMREKDDQLTAMKNRSMSLNEKLRSARRRHRAKLWNRNFRNIWKELSLTTDSKKSKKGQGERMYYRLCIIPPVKNAAKYYGNQRIQRTFKKAG